MKRIKILLMLAVTVFLLAGCGPSVKDFRTQFQTLAEYYRYDEKTYISTQKNWGTEVFLTAVQEEFQESSLEHGIMFIRALDQFYTEDDTNIKCIVTNWLDEQFNTIIRDETGRSIDDYSRMIVKRLDDNSGTAKPFGYNRITTGKLVNKIATLDDFFPAHVISSYIEEQQPSIDSMEYCFSLINRLSGYEIFYPDVKESFDNYLSEIRDIAFNNSEKTELLAYINAVVNNLDNNIYVKMIDCFPYDEMVSIIKKMPHPIIEDGQGGYYDTKKEKYPTVVYKWYSPLTNEYYQKGEVGTYQKATESEFLGDFLVRSISKYWYDTAENDPNNEKSVVISFRGHSLFEDKTAFSRFFNMMSPEKAYYISSDESKTGCAVFILNKGSITIASSNLKKPFQEYFTIQYS